MTVFLKECWVILVFCLQNKSLGNSQKLSLSNKSSQSLDSSLSGVVYVWMQQDLPPLLSVESTGESAVTSCGRPLTDPEVTQLWAQSVICPLIGYNPKTTHFQLNKQIKLWPLPRSAQVTFMTCCVHNPKKILKCVWALVNEFLKVMRNVK